MWDAEFYAFGKLSDLAKILLPGVRYYTNEQCDALHEYAKIIARDLTNGEYEYNKKRHKEDQ